MMVQNRQKHIRIKIVSHSMTLFFLAFFLLIPAVSLAGGLYSNIENLVLWARSEKFGYAINQVCYWFQVSGFRCQ